MPTPTLWQSEKLYQSGDAYYHALQDAIATAKRQIVFETYIFELDAIGRSILEALAQAAERGVRVRLLVDGIGSMAWSQATLKRLRARGIEAKIYHPVAPHAFRLGPLLIRRWLRALLKINRRNHRKVCVIDGNQAFLGGMNISHKHSEAISGEKAWRDTSVQVRGPECSELVFAFELAWRQKMDWRGIPFKPFKRKQRKLPHGNLVLNYRRRLRAQALRRFCARIESASTRVWITNPYFVPQLRLLRALRRSARRGVDVRMIFPHKNDILLVRVLSGAFYGVLFEAGVRIFEFLPSVLHAKTTIVDDWCSVGSSNLNHRSVVHDLEVDVALNDPKTLAQLEKAFESDLRSSVEIDHIQWLNRSWWSRAWEKILSGLRYWS